MAQANDPGFSIKKVPGRDTDPGFSVKKRGPVRDTDPGFSVTGKRPPDVMGKIPVNRPRATQRPAGSAPNSSGTFRLENYRTSRQPATSGSTKGDYDAQNLARANRSANLAKKNAGIYGKGDSKSSFGGDRAVARNYKDALARARDEAANAAKTAQGRKNN